MNIVYNGLYEGERDGMLTFSDIPNILKLEEFQGGSYADFSFQFDGNMQSSVSADGQYFCTFLGETVYSTMNPSNAKNKRFYISSDEDCTAMSFAQALRNCSSIAAQFKIVKNGNEVKLISKTMGRIWSNLPQNVFFQTNMPDSNFNASGEDGSADSIFFNSKVFVDVYSGVSINVDNYVTTLEKSWYGDSCSFDMSPILATFSEYGKAKPYVFDMSALCQTDTSQDYEYIGTCSGCTTIGFHANQSNKYLTTDGVFMLINTNRGENGMVLYTYDNMIPFSIMFGNDRSGYDISISALDSTFNEVYSSTTIGRRDSPSLIKDTDVVIPTEYFDNVYYVDIKIDNNEPIRFKVIKPLKATEYYQRIQWRNEYGGISFFDFTGSRSESDSVDIETYEKNIFDYYDNNNTFEKKKIYNNDYKKTVKLTSHLLERDGKWIFNSLMNSKKVWTEINGETYYIIPKSIEVQEDSTYDGIFTATLTYEYSDY